MSGAFALSRRWARLRARLLSPGAVSTLAGMADQVLISLANLGVGLLVLRLGTKQECGLYGLGYTAIIMANGFAAALFASQLTVAYYKVAPEGRAGFAGGIFVAQGVLTGVLCLLAFGAAHGFGLASLTGSPHEQAAALVILCCPAAMAHDLSRSYRFLLHQAPLALALDALNAVLWLGLTLLGIRQGLAVQVAALGGYGVACAVTSLVGLIGSGLAPVGLGAALARVRSVWAKGRWALGGVTVTALQNQAHLYILAWLSVVEAVAEVNAARMLTAPLGILVIGVNRGMLPLMVKMLSEDRRDAMRRLARGALLAVLGFIVAYLLAVFLAWDLLSATVLRNGYQHVGGLVLLWSLAIAIQAVDFNMSAQLQAEGRFRSLTLLNLYTAVPTVILAVPLIHFLGGTGSLLALAGGQAMLAVLLFLEVGQRREEEPAPTPV